MARSTTSTASTVSSISACAPCVTSARAAPSLRPGLGARTLAAGLLAVTALSGTTGAAQAADGPGGELRLVHEDRQPAGTGPLAAANTLQPGTAALLERRDTVELELRQRLLVSPAAGQPAVALEARGLAWVQRDATSSAATAAAGASSITRRSGLRVNELHAGTELGSGAGTWQLAAGRKVVSWDVGYAYRPNDVVQEEARRSLLPGPLTGRALLMAEHFDADDALAVVWVHPRTRHDEPTADQRTEQLAALARQPGDEQALALRAYHRAGALDLHGFARQGETTGTSLGAAAAWVASDALELHASLRALRHHVGWSTTAGGAPATPASALLRANPWQPVLAGPARQGLLGLQWTGESQQSLLVEAWHDGTAPAASTWRAWGARNTALASSPALAQAPAAARAGNLAWQATPLDGAVNLQRDNLLLRLAWQPPGWQLSVDTLYTPADHGRTDTAAVQWQGDRWRVNLAWRQAGGPSDALLRQVPTQRTLALSLASAF